MAISCPAPEVDPGLVQGLLGSVDCNVVGMVETGYATLAQPGSPVSAVLTILLTLYIAVLGLRMMMGRAPLRIGGLTFTALKIGIVLTLATNWPTYQLLVFDTLFRGPEQLATGLMESMQGSGSIFRGNPFDGLQLAYDELQRGAAFFSQRVVGIASPFQGGPGFAALALNVASLTLLMTTLGAVISAKIVLGVLLALGPVFVAFLLFDATRGVFEGWLRASLAFAIAPLLGLLCLVGQLTLMEPLLVRLAQTRVQGIADTGAATAIFMLCMIFVGVALASAIAVGVIAFSLRLPRPASSVDQRDRVRDPAANAPPGADRALDGDRRAFEPPPRAAAIAAAAAAMDRRESRILDEQPAPRRLVPSAAGGPTPIGAPAARPISQTYRRTAQPSRAASTVRRDR